MTLISRRGTGSINSQNPGPRRARDLESTCLSRSGTVVVWVLYDDRNVFRVQVRFRPGMETLDAGVHVVVLAEFGVFCFEVW